MRHSDLKIQFQYMHDDLDHRQVGDKNNVSCLQLNTDTKRRTREEELKDQFMVVL